MKNKIDYKCKECGHTELKKKNWRTKSWAVIRPFFVVVFVFNFMVGSMGIYNFLQTNVYENPDRILSIGQAYSFVVNIQSNFQFGEREKMLLDMIDEINIDCDNDERCEALTIFNHLSSFKYREGNATDLDPIITWEEKKGDCDQMAYLFLLLLKEKNINAMIDCNHNHCWTLISLDEKSIIADITKHRWIENE